MSPLICLFLLILRFLRLSSETQRTLETTMEDRQVWLARIRYAGKALKEVPFDERDEELCFEAVKRDARALVFVPSKYRTPALIERATATHWRALSILERHECTDRLLVIAARSIRDDGGLRFILARSRADAVLVELARTVPTLLFDAIGRALPLEAREVVVEHCPHLLPFLGDDFDKATIQRLVLQRVETLKYVARQTRDLCEAAIRHHHDAIAYIDHVDAQLLALHEQCEEQRSRCGLETLMRFLGPPLREFSTNSRDSFGYTPMTLNSIYEGRSAYGDSSLSSNN